MGHAGERHDLMSQETHAGQWIAFRQPVRRVAMERAGKKINRTYEANPGEVWEENEFWIDLSVKMDPDGKLGIRKWFESPYRKGEIVTVEEYYRWIFENSVPGLPEAAKAEGLSPLAYMRKYGAFEVQIENYKPFEKAPAALIGKAKLPAKYSVDRKDRIIAPDKSVVGVMAADEPKIGFKTPSRKLEFYSSTMGVWGWPEKEYSIPWPLKSHVHPDDIDRDKGDMLLLPNFRLPTLIHTRSANAKWLYEISHKNPVWMHPQDAQRLGMDTGDLVRVETEIGYFIDKVWVTEGIKPGVIAMSHHLGRWRLQEGMGVSKGSSSLVTMQEKGDSGHQIKVVPGARAWESIDPDTSRIWWDEVGVHQNLTHAVHPDPVSGAHCWHQKAISVRKAVAGEEYGEVYVDTDKSMALYREWVAKTRPAAKYSPDETYRPYWLNRPLRPVKAAYKMPKELLAKSAKQN